MKNLVFSFIYELILSVKNKIRPNLQHVIADIIWNSDFSLCEKDIAIVYNRISEVFCNQYKVKAPKLVFRQIDPNDLLMGLFEYKPYTISINIQALILNSMNSTSGLTAMNTLVFTLLHELRHCWQYKYYKEDMLYWTEKHIDLYSIFYAECPVEVDANRFAQSAGMKDDETVFEKLSLGLYEDFDKAVNLKEEAIAQRKIADAVAFFTK